MNKIIGRLLKSEIYGECTRILFFGDFSGKDEIDIEDGVMYLYVEDKLVRVSNTFDISIAQSING